MSTPPSTQADAIPPLGRMILYAVLAMLALAIQQVVLTLPGEVGPEMFLQLGAGALQKLESIAQAWHRLSVLSLPGVRFDLEAVAIGYLTVDTILFIPLYGAVFLEIARRCAGTAGRVLAVISIALIAVDLLENTSGLAKLTIVTRPIDGAAPSAVVLLFAAVAPALAFLFWRHATAGKIILKELWRPTRKLWRLAMAVSVVGAAITLIAALFDDASRIVLSVSAATHAAKAALTALLLVWLLGMGVRWLFAPGTPKADRGAVRRGIADILLRARYVLLVLAILIGLTLVMDQSRDIAIGVADGMLRWPEALWAWPTLALSVLSVWALSFSCWLWTRLACRMPGPRSTARDTRSAPANQVLETVARTTARVLGLVPPFVAALMSAYAARDAVWAASNREDGVVLSPLLLLLFGAASLMGGLLFLWNRERLGREGAPERYYDDPELTGNWMAQIAAEKYHFIGAGGPGPTLLSIYAFILAVGARCLVAMLQPGVPLAFAVIVLMLVAWLGFLGWLSLKEQREARPWGLAILIIAGVVGYAGFADNHIVRVMRGNLSAALPPVSLQVMGTILLAACVIVTAMVLVLNSIRAQAQRPVPLAWGWVLGIAAIAAMGVLIGVDRLARDESAPRAAETRRTLEQAFDVWTRSLWNSPQAPRSNRQHVYFVASEGGGMRAAYWTARALQELRHQVPGFNDSTFMLSGVSGGAVGAAVYVACSQHGADEHALADCIRDFGKTDTLTPMIGAWLFEDVLARVLPTSAPRALNRAAPCRQPGCGFMSRGLWFEQALERATPQLREGIVHTANAAGGWVPQLFLNSTWVESGDRAIGSGVRVDWDTAFPAARDQISYAAEGGSRSVDLPLSTAAHNAGRFPFVNALGVLRKADRLDSGHLADGGYFDNSGAHTTHDVLAAFRVWSQGKGCQRRSAEFCAWLASLRPTVLVIQNGVSLDCHREPDGAAELACLRREWKIDPPLDHNPAYEPLRPAATARLALFADAAGPLVTVVNVSGTGANGRRAAALLQEACQQFGDGQEHCVVQIAQRTDGALYPLGWYLSPTARAALDKKATTEVRLQGRGGFLR